MSEDKDLLARISQLAGHINLHKGQDVTNFSGNGISSSVYIPLKRHKSTQSFADESTHTVQSEQRSRVGRSRYSQRGRNYRHRSLVLTKGKNIDYKSKLSTETTAEQMVNLKSTSEPTSIPQDPTVWVSKRDRHMQLINASVYEKDASLRTRAIEQTRQQRLDERNARERQKNNTTIIPTAKIHTGSTVQPPVASLAVNVGDIVFHVSEGGSKLTRDKSTGTSIAPTPKSTTVGGVQFHRSKNGNLYRAGLVRSRRLRFLKKKSEPCKRFSLTGRCGSGPHCAYVHDFKKVAICRNYLRTGNCPRGAKCDLSHEPTYERVPACLHFLRGNCSNPNCRYAHVKVNIEASVCKAFASFGYCTKGATCGDRHMFECPDYSNSGICRKASCRLPHIDRAGQLRNQIESQADGKRQDYLSDVSSDEGISGDGIEDIDSDEFEEEILGHQGDQNNSFSDDFMHF